MKYLFITLKVQDGEHEHTHRVLHTTRDSQNALKAADRYAKTYWGKSYTEDGWFYFDGGGLAIKVEDVEVLTEFEYNLMSKIFAGQARPGYFQIKAAGYNESLEREEIQIHCGENGNMMIVKTPEGFVVDVYKQEDHVETLTVWEDDLSPLEIHIDPILHADKIAEFLLTQGQKHSEITANLGLRPSHADSDEILMEDYFYLEGHKRWYPKEGNTMYTDFQSGIAVYLRNNRDNY